MFCHGTTLLQPAPCTTSSGIKLTCEKSASLCTFLLADDDAAHEPADDQSATNAPQPHDPLAIWGP